MVIYQNINGEIKMVMLYTIIQNINQLSLFRKLLVAVGIVLMFTGLYVLLAENKLLGLPWTWFDTWAGIFILYNYAVVLSPKKDAVEPKAATPVEKTAEDLASDQMAGKLIIGFIGIGAVMLLIQMSTFALGHTPHFYLGTIGTAIILLGNWFYEVMQD